MKAEGRKNGFENKKLETVKFTVLAFNTVSFGKHAGGRIQRRREFSVLFLAGVRALLFQAL